MPFVSLLACRRSLAAPPLSAPGSEGYGSVVIPWSACAELPGLRAPERLQKELR